MTITSGRNHCGFTSALSLLVLLATLGARSTHADDKNPLNLPVPLNEGKVGSVMLHGGGRFSDEIFEKFLELAGGTKAKIILIPSGIYVQEDDESRDEFLERLKRRYGTWLRLRRTGLISDFDFLTTDNQEDADNPDFLADLREATGVWIPAAYQGRLAWRLTHRYSDPDNTTETLFQRALRDVVARGGVVGGFGGGMAALPDVMILGEHSENRSDVPEAVTRAGLGLFNGAIVDQNFDAYGGRLERFTGLLKNTARLNEITTWPAVGRNMIGLAVEQDTALIVQGNTVHLMGSQHGHVFLKGNGNRTISWEVLSKDHPKVELVAASSQSKRAAATVDPRSKVDSTRRNPFGMPEPHTRGKPGIVVLHGGGWNGDLMAVYPSLSGVPAPRMVHCPSALPQFQPQPRIPIKETMSRIDAYFHEWVAMRKNGQLASLDFLTTAARADADDMKFVQPITQAHAVWFSGGDQSELSRLFVNEKSPTLFEQEVMAVVARGGVVGGSSAGTAVMAKVMTIPGKQIYGEPADPEISCGLGVLKNVILEQHYNGEGRGGRLERFTSLLLGKNPETNQKLRKLLEKDGTRFDDMIGLAIEERTALLLQENRLRVFGKGHAHVFLKSADRRTITWHELESGDSAFIFFGPNGPVLELDDWRVR